MKVFKITIATLLIFSGLKSLFTLSSTEHGAGLFGVVLGVMLFMIPAFFLLRSAFHQEVDVANDSIPEASLPEKTQVKKADTPFNSNLKSNGNENNNQYTSLTQPSLDEEQIIAKVNNIDFWYSFINEVDVDSEFKEVIETFLIEDEISPLIFTTNKDADSDPYRFLMYEKDKFVSKSLMYILENRIKVKYLPDWFYYSYPDVALWTITNDLSELIERFKYDANLDSEFSGIYYSHDILRGLIFQFLDINHAELECTISSLNNKVDYNPSSPRRKINMPNDNEGLKRIVDSNPDLKAVVETSDQNNIENFLRKNPSVLNESVNELIHADTPSEVYRLKAIDALYDDHDTLGAIKLLNQGLSYNDKENIPFLYWLRSECFDKLDKSTEALNDISLTIDLLNNLLPLQYYNLHNAHNDRSKILSKKGDTVGANIDLEKAHAYLKLDESMSEKKSNDDLQY